MTCQEKAIINGKPAYCGLNKGHVGRHDNGALRWIDQATVDQEENVVVERVAEAIHRATWDDIHPDPVEYERITGFKPKLWKTDAPWDTRDDELAEHERDDYRWQAKAAIAAMREEEEA